MFFGEPQRAQRFGCSVAVLGDVAWKRPAAGTPPLQLEGGRPRSPRGAGRLAGTLALQGVDEAYSRLMLAISSRNDSARPLAIMKRTWAMVSPG